MIGDLLVQPRTILPMLRCGGGCLSDCCRLETKHHRRAIALDSSRRCAPQGNRLARIASRMHRTTWRDNFLFRPIGHAFNQ